MHAEYASHTGVPALYQIQHKHCKGAFKISTLLDRRL